MVRKDFKVDVEGGKSIFGDIENCPPDQFHFFQQKIYKVSDLKSQITDGAGNITRIGVSAF